MRASDCKYINYIIICAVNGSLKKDLYKCRCFRRYERLGGDVIIERYVQGFLVKHSAFCQMFQALTLSTHRQVQCLVYYCEPNGYSAVPPFPPHPMYLNSILPDQFVPNEPVTPVRNPVMIDRRGLVGQ